MIDRPNNINVFMLYAEEDMDLKRELETHLSLLNQKGIIDIWHEEKIIYNKSVDDTIKEHLENAQIILLLISANFLAPEVYGKYEGHLREAYKRQEAGITQIIPVILRPCVWQLDILANLNPLPKEGYPVRSRHWESRDLAFQNIAMGILNIVDVMKNGSPAVKPPPLPFKKKVVQNTPTDQTALTLINQLFQILIMQTPNIGEQQVIPLIHRSLLVGGTMEEGFKKYKLGKAFERVHLYRVPVVIDRKKKSGRISIGTLLNKEEGEEWIYHLKKNNDLGGITGQVRIFYPKNGSAKISSISL